MMLAGTSAAKVGAMILGLTLLAAPAFGASAPAAKPAPQPSAFQKEQQMSPAELIRRWKGYTAKASQRFGVPLAWINAVMRMESGGRTMLHENQPMVSDKGALGIMQVMPGTYQEMKLQYRLGADPFDPRDNIYAGAAYLKWLKGKYGFPALFAAYNAGPGQVDDFLTKAKPLPAETQNYIAGISKILDGAGGADGTAMRLAKMTRPDGAAVMIDPLAVRSLRQTFPGEYTEGVHTLINMGVWKQGVVEDLATVRAAIKIRGGRI
jgi:membrane-bound lytic murein transglycosylase B